MKTKELILAYIKRGFNGCHLRSSNDVVERLKKDFGCNITATTTEHSLILTFDVEEGLAIQFDLQTNPLNGLKNWCTNIKIVE
jgi:hypothetical protein